MENFKVNSRSDNRTFIVTESYRNLYNKLNGLKNSRGRIIHVISAPGTGKSSNIYAAMNELNSNFYDLKLDINNLDEGAGELFNQIYSDMKTDLKSKSKTELYQTLAGYDALLIADKFHDSHLINNTSIGYSLWTKNKGISSFKFYLLCINEYIRNKKYYKGINLVFQTAWRVKIGKSKYDLFTDFGIFSKFCVGLMKLLFEVVEIKYTRQETIKIVQAYMDVDEKTIEGYIDKYGRKPRLICQAIVDEPL